MREFFEMPFWGRGFRPFFLFGALQAAAIILYWVFIFRGSLTAPTGWNNPVLWHAHEMIFGFTIAIVAGFLLTAVANWAGGAPVRQMHLAFLWLVWVAGRIAFCHPYASPVILAAVDLAFIPLLAASLAVPLIRAKNNHNLIFIGIFFLLFLGNLHMHLSAMGMIGGDPRVTAYVAVIIMMMIISIVGSRIIPSFTVAGLRRRGELVYQTDQRKTDIAAMLLLLLLAIVIMASGLDSIYTGVVALVAGGIHLWRMRFWHTLEARHDPLSWILHAGHLWLVAGLLVLGLHGLGLVSQPSPGLHLLTVGSIGSMTIGMMARVALGHTGRSLEVSPLIRHAFWMMQGAALVRFLAFFAGEADYNLWVIVAGLLWSGSFLIYLFVYAPILWGPRPDGFEA